MMANDQTSRILPAPPNPIHNMAIPTHFLRAGQDYGRRIAAKLRLKVGATNT